MLFFYIERQPVLSSECSRLQLVQTTSVLPVVFKNASDRLAARYCCGPVGVLRRFYRSTGRKVNPEARII